VWTLLAQIIGNTPKLDGASCTNGHRQVFLADKPDIEACQLVCSRCPALQPCSAWAETQPQLEGVVAGRVRVYDPTLPKQRIQKPHTG
jgi:Transcription factor WhiB